MAIKFIFPLLLLAFSAAGQGGAGGFFGLLAGKSVPAPTNQFIITVKTDNTSSGSTDANTFRFPTTSVGTYNCTIDWGDGHVNTLTVWNSADRERTYASAGTYTITVTGQFEGFSFANSGDRLKLLEVGKFGTAFRLLNNAGYFQGCTNMVFSPTIDVLNLTGTTSLANAFNSCSSFNSDISAWNVSGITLMTNVFLGATSFNQPLDSWNISNVTNISSMFQGANSFNQPLNSWNTSSVTLMNSVFSGASSFNQDLDNWNTSNVISMSATFQNAVNFNGLVGSWDVSSVQGMGNMFFGCTNFNQPLNSWNVIKCTNMSQMLRSATSFNQPLDNWNVSNVTSFLAAFVSASSFNQNLGNWNLNAAVNLGSMLNTNGMDCTNYSATLIGWAANPSTPSGRSLGATGRRYGTNAASARTTLTATLGWTITGDIAETFTCP